MKKIFSLLGMTNGANWEIACCKASSFTEATEIFRKSFALNSNGYAKIGPYSYCVAENYEPIGA